MDSYQMHTHPRPTVPHTGSVHSISWPPKLQWGKEWQHINFIHPAHHFHFPATSIHDLKSRAEKIRYKAQPPCSISAQAPWAPDADIRETGLAYFIEIEMPCVTDKNSILIQWLSARDLLVRGDISRPDIAGKAAEGGVGWVQDGPDDTRTPHDMQEKDGLTNGNGVQRVLSHETQVEEAGADVLSFLLSERKVGAWQRTFSLPLDIENKRLKARLNGGLLSIELRKQDMSGEPKVKINIE